MKIAFQMEPLSKVKPQTNSSAHLIQEALTRKYTIYHYEPQNLSLRDGEVYAFAAEVKAFDKVGDYKWISLNTMDAVMVRQDPTV